MGMGMRGTVGPIPGPDHAPWLLPPQRPPFCPMKLLAEPQTATLPAELRGRGVDVGVAVLLQTSDRRVLLTRRAPGLSIFPNIWVPPGERRWGRHTISGEDGEDGSRMEQFSLC